MPRAVAAAALITLAACVPNEGPSMRPFEDCLECHDGSSARGWSVAGTWSKGAQIVIVDRTGKSVTLHGNDVGNFYTAESLSFPLSVSVDGTPMAKNHGTGAAISLTYGGCNVCHHAQTVTVGPLMAPGRDCLHCHGPNGMAVQFSSAGTVTVGGAFPAGATVRVGGYTTTANQAGNFYFYASTSPLSFPASASVNGSAMEGGAPRGGCNGCHLGGVGSSQGTVGGGN
jgi:hypothetical protein